MEKKEMLRKLPQIDQVLRDQRFLSFTESFSMTLRKEAIKEIIHELRTRILAEKGELDSIPYEEIIDRAIERTENMAKQRMHRVINGTGVILHTNVGRAPLGEEVSRKVAEAAKNYVSLEYDLTTGRRGTRLEYVETLLTLQTGAEAAMVVNNNAAALILSLSTLGKKQKIAISKGELIEIGGEFRLPEIIEASGAISIEVGTTNKTRIEDYQQAIDKHGVRALLKIHTSNYKILGFTEETSLEKLISLGREKRIPVIYDLGSGLFIDLKEKGIQEPTINDSIEAGTDIVLFSGDKLFGGPQAGILIGKKKYIQEMKKNPIARAFRIDKLSLAALEVTLENYLEPKEAWKKVPVLSMLLTSEEDLKERAEGLARKIQEGTNRFTVAVETTESPIGGGAAPLTMLKGYGVTIYTQYCKMEALEKMLRQREVPIIARIKNEKILLDVRTIRKDEEGTILRALQKIETKLKEIKIIW